MLTLKAGSCKNVALTYRVLYFFKIGQETHDASVECPECPVKHFREGNRLVATFV